MAAIKATFTDVSSKGDGSAVKAVWTPVTSSDTFVSITMPEYVARSVHVSGTFGAATVIVSGGNASSVVGLHDLQDTAISMTSENIEQVQEGVINYQPSASGGDGTQSLTVTMLFVGPRRY